MNNILELHEKDKVFIEIYKLTSKTSGKSYIGQAVSHILNHNKYRKYGMIRRFKCHVSEAYSKKKKQCFYLNNAIKKYGQDDFILELITTCKKKDADRYETDMIIKYNTLYPNGYNLKTGGQYFSHTKESRRRVSDGVYRYYIQKKIDRFQNIILPPNINFEEMIKPLKRDNRQYGWYITINKKRVDFGGVHISLNESKKRLLEFIKMLQNK